MENKHEYLLEMNGIEKSFPGVKALDKVNLKVRAGRCHALLGENGAGKSTLMKCLFGIYQEDAGEIIFEGKPTRMRNSKHALDNGISMVHQELNQVRTTRIVDNIWLGRFPKKYGFIDEGKMYEETKKVFQELGISLDPRQGISELTVSEAQMVEIAKAVSYDSKLIVMDEPTSSLSEKEVNHLFDIIDRLKKKNVAVIFISHKLEEVKRICEDLTVMRDGKWVATQEVSNTSMEDMINLMVGRELKERFPEKYEGAGELILEVEGLTALAKNSIKDVSFTLKKGEILGVAGLVGSKRTDLLECLFGERNVASGSIKIHGKEVKNLSPKEAINNGFALVTEERRANGIFAELDINFNSIIANIDEYIKYGFISDSDMSKSTDWVIESMNVKTPSHKTKIKTLSGGNQQKVILGRWLLTEPDVFLMDEPTRGIDVGAKYEIYQLMISLAKKGKAVIMVSSEMPEILGVSNRVLVMSNGRAAGIVDANETTQEEILKLSAKHL